jgi:hypothetical protein
MHAQEDGPVRMAWWWGVLSEKCIQSKMDLQGLVRVKPFSSARKAGSKVCGIARREEGGLLRRWQAQEGRIFRPQEEVNSAWMHAHQSLVARRGLSYAGSLEYGDEKARHGQV